MDSVTGGEWDLDDVVVTIDHNFGKVEESLVWWMARGPGPRPGLRPVAARSRATGEPLPLTVIPLAYRNDRESRALIAAGRIDPPWPGQGGGPPAFDRSVADPDRADHLATRVLAVLPSGPVDDEAVRLVLTQVPAFRDEAPGVVRRLAAEARWDEFDTIVGFAGAAGLADVGWVLCDVLDSDAGVPRPGHIVDVLGQLRFDDAAEPLHRQLGRFVYVDVDPAGVRRCLRALGAIRRPGSRVVLALISWEDWPDPISQWAAQELEASGA